MSDSSGLPPRPLPSRGVRQHVAGWIGWFDPVRLVLTLIAAAAVGFGAFWLVRSPSPPTEASLPFAAASTTVADSMPAATSTVSSTVAASPATVSETVSVVVHVAGAVTGPGVYLLDGSARVHSAIDAAGGPTSEADLDGLNLAAPVADGQRIYVPSVGEVDPADVPSGPPRTEPSVDGGAPAGPVDLNRAGAAELEALPGVGPATAAAIVDDRDRNGPFASVDDLDRVPGIGPAKLEALRDLVTV